MPSSQDNLIELKQQLAKGSIQQAYRALISFMAGLRTHFAREYGESAVSALYQGFMDMTYFALVPPAFKPRGLKVAIVFNYEAFRFEIWLAARNRKIQRETWEVFKGNRWPNYRVVTPGPGIDAIVECDLASGLDLVDSGEMTELIESAAAAFIRDMEDFLSERQPRAVDDKSGVDDRRKQAII